MADIIDLDDLHRKDTRHIVKDSIIRFGGRLYRILNIVGQGGFGIAYKVVGIETSEFFILKEIGKDDGAIAEVVIYKMLTEQMDRGDIPRLFPRLIAHTGILTSERINTYDSFYILMEHIDGQSLGQYLYDMKKHVKEDNLNQEAIFQLLYLISVAIHIFHKVGYIHRDIHSGNIILRAGSNIPIIIDFGMSCTKKTCSKWGAGARQYNPPEISAMSYGWYENRTDRYEFLKTLPCYIPSGVTPDDVIDNWDKSAHRGNWTTGSDIFALGVNFHEIVHQSKKYKILPNMKLPIDDLIAKMVHYDVKKRISSMSDVVKWLIPDSCSPASIDQCDECQSIKWTEDNKLIVNRLFGQTSNDKLRCIANCKNKDKRCSKPALIGTFYCAYHSIVAKKVPVSDTRWEEMIQDSRYVKQLHTIFYPYRNNKAGVSRLNEIYNVLPQKVGITTLKNIIQNRSTK